MKPNAIQRLSSHRQRMGAGLTVTGLRAQAELLDPFIAVDHFHMTQPTFPPHPHAGFSAVTYLFEDSETGFLNRDSLGFEGPIEPGDLHWTLAGSGVMHEEFPLVQGRVAHGLQVFVNLPAQGKQQAPRAMQLAAAQMPVLAGAGWQARLVFGRMAGAKAPLALPLDAALAIVDVEPGHDFTPPLAATQQGFALLLRGDATVGLQQFLKGEAFAFAAAPTLRACSPLRFALFFGTPLREPLVQHGPFVMNTEAEIVDAMRRYQQGGMGRLSTAVAA